MIYRSESLRWAIAVYPQLTYEQIEYLHGLMVELIPSAAVSHAMPNFNIREGVWFWPFYELPAGSDDNATATRLLRDSQSDNATATRLLRDSQSDNATATRLLRDSQSDNATATREREPIPVSYEEYECWLELAEEQTAAKYDLSLVSFEG